MTKSDINKIGAQFAELLRYEALNFLNGNSDAAIELGKSELNAIFQSQFWLQPVPVLRPDMTPEELVDVEDRLGQRDIVFQLVAKAESQNAKLTKKLKQQAADAALRIGNTILSVGASALTGELTRLMTKT